MPSFIHAKNSKVLVNAVDLSAYLKSYAYAIKVDQAEATAFGAQVKAYVVGLDGSTLSLTGFFDGSVGAVDAIFYAAMGAATPTIVTVSPTGSFALGARVFTGSCIEADYSVQGAIGSVVDISTSFTGTPNVQPGFGSGGGPRRSQEASRYNGV